MGLCSSFEEDPVSRGLLFFKKQLSCLAQTCRSVFQPVLPHLLRFGIFILESPKCNINIFFILTSWIEKLYWRYTCFFSMYSYLLKDEHQLLWGFTVRHVACKINRCAAQQIDAQSQSSATLSFSITFANEFGVAVRMPIVWSSSMNVTQHCQPSLIVQDCVFCLSRPVCPIFYQYRHL